METTVDKKDGQYCVTIKDDNNSVTKLQIKDLDHVDGLLGNAEYEVQKWQQVKDAIVELESEVNEED